MGPAQAFLSYLCARSFGSMRGVDVESLLAQLYLVALWIDLDADRIARLEGKLRILRQLRRDVDKELVVFLAARLCRSIDEFPFALKYHLGSHIGATLGRYPIPSANLVAQLK